MYYYYYYNYYCELYSHMTGNNVMEMRKMMEVRKMMKVANEADSIQPINVAGMYRNIKSMV